MPIDVGPIRKFSKYNNKIASMPVGSIKTELELAFEEYKRIILTTQSLLSESQFRDACTKGFLALNRLFKFAKYLQEIKANQHNERQGHFLSSFTKWRKKDSYHTQKKLCLELILDMKQGNYDKVIKDFNTLFSSADWEKVEAYFGANPKENFCGSKQGLMYSYLKVGEQIERREDILGSGGFGCVKKGVSKDNDGFSAIKRQKPTDYKNNEVEKNKAAEMLLRLELSMLQCQKGILSLVEYGERVSRLAELVNKEPLQVDVILTEYHYFPAQKKEAAFNLDLDIATSDLVVRRDEKGNIYKVYQRMKDLGLTITEHLKKTKMGDDGKLNYSIDLLLHVDDYHSGQATKSKKPLTHGDIKPDNILVGYDGVLRLVDTGTVKDSVLDKICKHALGTLRYLPQDFDSSTGHFSSEIKSTTPFLSDKIAALRTIYHPSLSGILTEATFNQLPSYVSNLLGTHDISICINESSVNTLKYIASALIFYRYYRHLCTEQFILDLATNKAEQTRLIEEYKKLKSENNLKAERNIAKAVGEPGAEKLAAEAKLIEEARRAEEARLAEEKLAADAKLVEEARRARKAGKSIKSTTNKEIDEEILECIKLFDSYVSCHYQGHRDILTKNKIFCQEAGKICQNIKTNHQSYDQKAFNKHACEEISKLANRTFKHRDFYTRLLADLFFIPLGIATVGVLFLAKYNITGSPTFFTHKTSRQQKLEESLSVKQTATGIGLTAI